MNTEQILEKYNKFEKQRLVVSVVASAYFIYYCFTSSEWHFIDNINLIIHEAGHSVFMFFGEFLNILGGSFLQIAFPILFLFYFYKKQEYFSASLLLFWVGQNILNVSVYASDAIVMQLPLLGGDSVGHDWNNLLQMTGLLKYTDLIGSSIHITGIAIIICAIFFSLTISLSKNPITILKKFFQ